MGSLGEKTARVELTYLKCSSKVFINFFLG